MSGRFAGKTKEWCFRVFMACDDDILNDLKCLGPDTYRKRNTISWNDSSANYATRTSK